jgi:hypothetical protein
MVIGKFIFNIVSKIISKILYVTALGIFILPLYILIVVIVTTVYGMLT